MLKISKIQKNWWIFSIITFIFALGILFFSCLIVSPVYLNQQNNLDQGRGWNLYFSLPILPDHIFYPAIIAFERLQFFLSSEIDDNQLRFKVSQKRLRDAELLITKRHRHDLAFLTLNKSHSYLVNAFNYLLQVHPQSHPELIIQYRQAQKIIESNQQILPQLASQLNGDAQARIGVILSEQNLLMDELVSHFNN